MLVVVGGALLDSVDQLDEPQHHRERRRAHPGLRGASPRTSSPSRPMGGNDPDLSPMEDWRTEAEAPRVGPQREDGRPDGDQRRADHRGNTVDLTLEELRSVVREAKEHGNTPGAARHGGTSLKEHVRQIVRVLQARPGPGRRTSTPPTRSIRKRGRPSSKASSDEFWADFDQDPLRRARVPGEPARAPWLLGRRPGAPALRGHRPRHVPEDLRPHGDRRRAAGAPGPPRLPDVEVLLRGPAQAQDRAAAGQDQGGAGSQGRTIARDETLQRYVQREPAPRRGRSSSSSTG